MQRAGAEPSTAERSHVQPSHAQPNTATTNHTQPSPAQPTKATPHSQTTPEYRPSVTRASHFPTEMCNWGHHVQFPSFEYTFKHLDQLYSGLFDTINYTCESGNLESFDLCAHPRNPPHGPGRTSSPRACPPALRPPTPVPRNHRRHYRQLPFAEFCMKEVTCIHSFFHAA